MAHRVLYVLVSVNDRVRAAPVRLVRRVYAGAVPINPQDVRPLSAQIAQDLRVRIRRGDFPVGAKFPSLRTLGREYGVAELTVHAAVRQLQHEGVLVSTSGRGTFVRELPDAAGDDGSVLAALGALRDEVRELRQRVEALEAAQHSSTSSQAR